MLRLGAKGAHLHPRFHTRVMHWQHRAFDRAVARRLRFVGQGTALVGLPGASRESFTAAKSAGGICVLHVVNSHPRVQNELLASHCGLRRTHHEMIPERIARRVEAELLLADLILVPSEFVMAQLTAREVPSHKMALVPFGVDVQTFRPRGARQQRVGPVRVVFVGQISHRKGVPLLLEAMKLLGSAAVADMYGPMVSPEVMKGAPGNVRWHGVRSPIAVAQAMSQGDVFVLPSVEDNSGLVVTEALASGLPVVTTSSTGASRFVTDGRNGHVLDDPDPEALAHAIRAAYGLDLPIALPDTCPTWDAYGAVVMDLVDQRAKSLLRGSPH